MKERKKFSDRKQPVSIYETSLTDWKDAAELADFVKKLNYTHVELHPVMEYLDDEARRVQHICLLCTDQKIWHTRGFSETLSTNSTRQGSV